MNLTVPDDYKNPIDALNSMPDNGEKHSLHIRQGKYFLNPEPWTSSMPQKSMICKPNTEIYGDGIDKTFIFMFEKWKRWADTGAAQETILSGNTNCYFHDFTVDGNHMNDSGGAAVSNGDNSVTQKLKIRRSWGAGFAACGNNVTIEECNINTVHTGICLAPPWKPYSGQYFVRKNRVENCGGDCLLVGSLVYQSSVDGLTVEDNYFGLNGDTCIDLVARIVPSQNAVIKRNTVFAYGYWKMTMNYAMGGRNSGWKHTLWEDNEIHSCLYIDGSDSRDVTVNNNVFWSDGVPCLSVATDTDSKITNNKLHYFNSSPISGRDNIITYENNQEINDKYNFTTNPNSYPSVNSRSGVLKVI